MTARTLLACLLAASLILVGGYSLYADTASPATHTLGGDIVISTLDNVQHLPAVAYNRKHNEYLVVWHNEWGGGGRDIYAQRVTASGELKSWFAVSAGGYNRAQPSVAYDPYHDRYLVVWIYDVWGDGSDWDVRGKFVPWNGPPDPKEFTICNWNSDQWNPVVVYNDHPNWPEFFVVWTNTQSTSPAYISGRRVPADGSAIAPNLSDVTINHATQERARPDIAYNLARNEYLVVYDDGLDILGTRLAANGSELGGGEFSIAGWPDAEERPAVAAAHTADKYLVAWQSFVYSHDYDIYARFVNGDGTMDGGPLHILDRTAHEQEADVACNAGAKECLVVFQEQFSNLTGPYGITGRSVSTDKTMGPLFGLVGPYPGLSRTNPAIASGPPGYLTAWEHDRAGTSFQDIHGRLYWPHVTFLPAIFK